MLHGMILQSVLFMTIPYIHRQIKEVETFSFAELYFLYIGIQHIRDYGL